LKQVLFDPSIKIRSHKKHTITLAGDTEDNGKGKTYLINFYDGKNHFTFRSPRKAVQWLETLQGKYEIWFANLPYDTGNVFRRDSHKLKITVAGSRFITCKLTGTKIVLKDIFNVLPGMSVKKLGNMVNLPKIEGTSFNNVKYCRRDTEIVYKSIQLVRKKFRVSGVHVKNTAASTAFGYITEVVPYLQKNDFEFEEHEFLRKGFYGGRTEVFNTSRIGGSIWGYDIVSMYPSIMRELEIVQYETRKHTKNPNLQFEGMCRCKVRTPKKLDIPYLPLRHDGKLVFPLGEFWGTWTYFELREAQKLGYKILEIDHAIEFIGKKGKLFQDFVDNFFEQRQDAKRLQDEVLIYVCKIMLNSGYGKTGQDNEHTTLVPASTLKLKLGESSVVFPNGQAKVDKVGDYPPFTNYMIAAMITAGARDKLYKEMLIPASRRGDLLYCDTDSVFYRGKALTENLGTELGKIQLEHEIQKCQFILPKTYFIEWRDGSRKYKCKGVKGDFAKQFFESGYAEFMSPKRYIETCRENLRKAKNKEKLTPFNVWMKKHKNLLAKYNKRTVLKFGRTKPLIIKA